MVIFNDINLYFMSYERTIERTESPASKFNYELQTVDSCAEFNELMNRNEVSLQALEIKGPSSQYKVPDGQTGYVIVNSRGENISPDREHGSWISFRRAREDVLNTARRMFTEKTVGE